MSVLFMVFLKNHSNFFGFQRICGGIKNSHVNLSLSLPLPLVGEGRVRLVKFDTDYNLTTIEPKEEL